MFISCGVLIVSNYEAKQNPNVTSNLKDPQYPTPTRVLNLGQLQSRTGCILLLRFTTCILACNLASGMNPNIYVKVSKSRKQILKFEPEHKRTYFSIYALASKSGQIKKISK